MSIMEPSPERLSLEEASTADLVREALDEAKELVRIEVELAKNEVEKEIADAKTAAVGFGIAAGAGIVVLSVLAMALVLALGGTALVALGVAAVFAAIAGGVGYWAYARLPKRPLEKTRRRIVGEVGELKEHIA